MEISSAKFKGRSCFKDSWAGFDEFKPITVIIGRNNTGKSRLLEFVEHLCEGKPTKKKWQLSLTGNMDEDFLKSCFPMNMSGGELGGHHWDSHGRHLIDVFVEWKANGGQITLETELPNDNPRVGHSQAKARQSNVSQSLSRVQLPFKGKQFKHLLADRDVQPEVAVVELSLASNGVGATNIVRRYITSTSLNRDLIQAKLLEALNEIFSGDGAFTEVQVQMHDGGDDENWEIFLGEESKGLISLSQSGSGLKTIFLVLLNLIALPELENSEPSGFVFAFEELENNLHPALQRRLMDYISEYSERHSATFFLTTHSNVTLDFFSRLDSAQIIHVSHDGKSAHTRTIEAHFDRAGIITELGAKPSDLLQANGVLWLEGPSDRVYLNRWIDIYSDGQLVEGQHYQCAYYGGAVLARMQFTDEESADDELTNLLRVNPNIAVVCDGDRTAETGEGSHIKGRVKRVKEEVAKIKNGHIWITDAKEIENYLTLVSVQGFSKATPNTSPKKRGRFFPSETSTSNYLKDQLGRKSVDKVELAMHAAPLMTKADLDGRFDLSVEVMKIVETIKAWNA
ncbi:ATP-dependent nuclease [Rubripirellula obstinata]|nr:ATP-binding protein [Rubripirellula obstinata]